MYLDVWGLGNRGMFRSIRDLLLRPGYMIRDYLRGMQMAYFPPFKMYFLVYALLLLIDTGMNIQGINRTKQEEMPWTERLNSDKPEAKQTDAQEKKALRTAGKTLTREEKKEFAKEEAFRKIAIGFKWINQHISGVMLVSLLVFSCPLWLLFRHNPAIPDIRLSECFVAMVYISTMLLIYNIVPSLLCFGKKAELTYEMISMLLVIIPIKQLSGFSYWSTIWRILIACIFLFAVILLLIAISSIFIIMNIYSNLG